MIDQLLVWFVKCYFSIGSALYSVRKVLKIKFTNVKVEKSKTETESKGHLAIRLSDTKSLTSQDLIALSGHVKKNYGVKYLTVITGNLGIEKEIEIKADDNLKLFHNFELLHDAGSDAISVNLISHDSESIFLLKLKEAISDSSSFSKSEEDVFKSTLKQFTDFPPIDLFLCMMHDFNFSRIFPFHLSFTHFYCCPVLADQTFSKEAICEGFRKFSLTKQNFGR